MKRRQFLGTACIGTITAGISPAVAAQEGQANGPTPRRGSGPEVQSSETLAESDQITVHRSTVDSETYISIVDNGSGAVRVQNVDRTDNIEANSVGEAENSADAQLTALDVETADSPEIIERSEYYRREIGNCSNNCIHHVVSGTSMEIRDDIANVGQAVIISAILAVLAASGAGTLATIFGNRVVSTIISSAGSNLIGENFTTGTWDYDIDYFIGSQNMRAGGYALGPWKPGPDPIVEVLTQPGHGPDCDWG